MRVGGMAGVAAGAFGAAALVGLIGVLLGDARAGAAEAAALRASLDSLRAELAEGALAGRTGHGRPNVLTVFNTDLNRPAISATSFVDPGASVIGDVRLGEQVYVAPFASIRGDEGQPIAIGDQANVQDGVVIHALETQSHGQPVANRTFEVEGVPYAVYIGRRVSLAHQSQVHGPARVDDGVFVGMQALVFKSWIGRGSVVEPGAKVIGVTVAPGRYVPAGSVVTSQAEADRLPVITEQYSFRDLNEAVVGVNTALAKGYGAAAAAAAESPEPVPHGEVASSAPEHAPAAPHD